MRSFLAIGLVVVAGLTANARTASAQPVDVPLNRSLVLTLPGVTQVVVMDDEICLAELTPEGIRFFGRLQGETIGFVWTGDRRSTLIVRVAAPPPVPVRSALSVERQEQIGLGQLGSSAQVATDPADHRTYDFQHLFSWSQQVSGRRLVVRGQARQSSRPGVPANVDALSVQYTAPGASFTFVDFGLNLDGGDMARITGHSPISPYTFRGVDVAFSRPAGDVEIFAGMSIPSYFRSTRGTSRIAGLKLSRRLSSQLVFHTTAAGISVPETVEGAPESRSQNVFGTTGLTYHGGDRWAAQVTAGLSNGGRYGDAALAFTGSRLRAWTTWTGSSPDFALNQLRVLSGGGTSTRAAAIWQGGSRLGASLFYQHSSTQPTAAFSSFAGRADYLSPSVSLMLSRSHTLTLSGVYSQSRGGFALGGRTRTRSMDAGWSGQLLGRFTNTTRVSWISSGDSEQVTSGARVSLREELGLRLKGGYLNVGVQRSAQDPSLVTRLRQQIGLLSPSEQELFLADPIAFVQSSSLPADVRDLIESIRSANSQFFASAQLPLGRRLNVSASYSRLKNTEAQNQHATTNSLGYVIAYQLTPSLQLRSSLSDTYYVDTRQKDLVRTTTYQLGLSVAFRGGPAWLTPSSPEYAIEGRVFVDRNITGTSETGEQGLAGISVLLDEGSRVVTDTAGRYRFVGLKAGAYRVSMPLDQFHDPIRVTTVTNVPVELFEQPQAQVDFGVVNFSRVMGAAFNDYALDGVRNGDSPGLPRVGLIVTDSAGMVRNVTTDGTGEYRIDDLVPGTYRLEVDPGTIPVDFMNVTETTTFEVKAVRTVLVDVPLRALRSVTGHVYVSATATGDPQSAAATVPAVGVTVIAAGRQSTTDATGMFVLRDLPAGDVTVTLLSSKTPPAGVSIPTGTLRLPKEPRRVDNATIVIRNPAVMDYLVRK